MSEALQSVEQPVIHPASAPSLIDTDTPAPAADDQKATPAATEGNAEPAAETTEQQEARKQSKFQRRLDRHKTARVVAETEAKLLREQLAKHEAQPQAPKDTGEPKREDFPDYETYLEKRTEWRVDQKLESRDKAQREASQGKETQERSAVEQQNMAKAWTERETAFMSAAKDYNDTVTPFVEEELGTLSEGARRAIVESDVGPQLLYHLAKHPDDAERIADLSPHRQIAELGKLEVTIKPVTKRTTNAPAPPGHLQQGGNSSTGFSEHESQAEYEAKRKTQNARWARN